SAPGAPSRVSACWSTTSTRPARRSLRAPPRCGSQALRTCTPSPTRVSSEKRIGRLLQPPRRALASLSHEPDERSPMRIEVKGLNVEVTDELREHVEKRFEKVDRMVSELATCDVVLSEERNPKIPERHKAEANLRLKGVLVHAKEH